MDDMSAPKSATPGDYTLPIARTGEPQFACIMRERSGENAGNIDFGLRDLTHMGDGGQSVVNMIFAMYQAACKQTGLIAKNDTQPAPPLADEVVAWAVDRDGDRTFPRIYATEAEADHMVFNVTVNPPAKKRAVIGYEAVKAALAAALGKGER